MFTTTMQLKCCLIVCTQQMTTKSAIKMRARFEVNCSKLPAIKVSACSSLNNLKAQMGRKLNVSDVKVIKKVQCLHCIGTGFHSRLKKVRLSRFKEFQRFRLPWVYGWCGNKTPGGRRRLKKKCCNKFEGGRRPMLRSSSL